MIRTAQMVWEQRWRRGLSPAERDILAKQLRNVAYRRELIKTSRAIQAFGNVAAAVVNRTLFDLYQSACNKDA